MRASHLMAFDYLTMMGVPVLLVLLVLNAALFHLDTLQTVLLVLIGAGCLVYGAIGIRVGFVRGRRRRETASR